MSRKYFAFLFSFLFIETAVAKQMIDCRVAIEDITECYPYGAKLLKTKEIIYDQDRKKLIRVKNLPRPEKKRFMRVVSVEEMIDKYVKIQDSMRFKGSDVSPIKPVVVKEPVSQELIDEKIGEIEESEVEPVIGKELSEKTDSEKIQLRHGQYTVVRGDALSKLAKKFGFKTKELAKMNGLKTKAPLRIGQKLKLPFEQKVIDALVSAKYKVEEGDTLISIAKKFNLDPKALVQFNGIKSNTVIRTGKIIKLPLPYVLAQKKKEEAKKKRIAQQKKSGKVKLLREFGKRKLRVTATAYSSHAAQTDSTPFLAAWNNRIRPGMKIIAVSRDMLTRYGMRNGTKVRIGGLPGYYRVRDKMNKRYKKRIDIYMGLDRRKALRWGRRSVVIYW
jgi:LysM repeat protein